MAQLKNTTINVSESGAAFNITTNTTDNIKIFYNSDPDINASQIVTSGKFNISANDLLTINEPTNIVVPIYYFGSLTDVDFDMIANYAMQGEEANSRLGDLSMEYVDSEAGNGKTLGAWMSDIEAASDSANNALNFANSAVYGIFDSSLSSKGISLDLSGSFTEESSVSASGIKGGINKDAHMYAASNTTTSGLLANDAYIFKNNNAYAFIESTTNGEPGTFTYTPIFSTSNFSGNYSYANRSIFSENTGFRTIVNDIGGHAEGAFNTVNEKFSHAEGAFNNIYSRYSHAEGGRNDIYSNVSIYSHAEGFLNRIAPNKTLSPFGGILKVAVSANDSYIAASDSFNDSITLSNVVYDSYNGFNSNNSSIKERRCVINI